MLLSIVRKEAKGDWDFPGSLIQSKTLMEIFNPCGEFRWSPEGPVNYVYSPHLHAGAPGIFSGLSRSVQTLKRKWGAKSNGKLPHLFIPSKTATLVPEFAVEDLPLDRTATLVPVFAVKYLSLRKPMASYRTYLSLIKLQPWLLSLQWKTCLWTELQLWFLRLQWKTCPWAEHSDNDRPEITKKQRQQSYVENENTVYQHRSRNAI